MSGSTITRSDLIKLVKKSTLFQENDVKEVIDSFIEEIINGLELCGTVKITGLGTFYIHIAKPSKGRNPKTGEPLQLGERKIPKFKVAPLLRDKFRKS